MDGQAEFTIVDLRSGRGLGGHCFDYLLALQAAFADRTIRVDAPFVGPNAVRNTRLNVYLQGLRAYRAAIAGRGAGIVHNSSLNDYLCLAAAALTVRPSRRGFCMMMLYRDPSPESFGAGGPTLNKAVIWLIGRLIRKGVILPMSDSQAVLSHWTERFGSSGDVVPTPPLPTADEGPAAGLRLPSPGGPLVVIPGRMRAEKGAAAYPEVTRAVLAEFPDGAIAIQTSEGDPESDLALMQLRDEFGADQRVLLIDQHLTGSEYSELLAAADIAVLPYDTARYGAGSSGVVGDVLESGGVVVATPIDWITAQYSDQPRVVLVDDVHDRSSLRAALSKAHAVEPGSRGGGRAADFNRQWTVVVNAALAKRS